MKQSKYLQEIHETYLPKFQYAIDVMNSCTTRKQIDTCTAWLRNLLNQWDRFEWRRIRKWDDGVSGVALSWEVNRKLYDLYKMYTTSVNRKVKELPY